MISENYQSRLRMRTLIRENIQAPLYRLPTAIFKSALPNVIGDGHLTKPEIDTLVEYINRAEELNRGLERAGAAHAASPGGSKALEDEYRRNVAKANEILNEEDPDRFGGAPLIDAADWCLHKMDDLYSKNWIGNLLRCRSRPAMPQTPTAGQ